MPVKTIIAPTLNKSNPLPKHLLIFLDGTWNDENGRANDGVTTSIYKLFRALEGKLDTSDVPHLIKNDHQLALYFRGLGNDDENGMEGIFFEGAFGAGEKRIRDNAYCHVLKYYRPGDKLSIFGFSRGAACARMLAQSLQSRGLFTSLKYHYRKEANPNTGKLETVFKKFSSPGKQTRPVDVAFLGIFDTVGAFGLPIDLGFSFQKVNIFKNMSIASNVREVVHCVGIDETREAFIPTLCNAANHIDEVWFAGVHGDLGGAYRQRELATIPLNYMVKKLRHSKGFKTLQFNENALAAITTYNLEGDNNLHYHGDGLKKEIRNIYVQVGNKPSRKRPKIHRSVFRLMESERMFLASPFHSFTKLDKILYCPRGVGNFTEKTTAID